MDRRDAEREPLVAYARKSGVVHQFGEAVRVREGGHRARQGAVSGGISAEQRRDERHEPMEVQSVTEPDERARRGREIEDHGPAAPAPNAAPLPPAPRAGPQAWPSESRH